MGDQVYIENILDYIVVVIEKKVIDYEAEAIMSDHASAAPGSDVGFEATFERGAETQQAEAAADRLFDVADVDVPD